MAKIKAPLQPGYLEQPYETNDEPLSRLVLAERLTALYSNLEHGSVAILNGRWGSGKSTFARKLVHHLSAKKISVTYFDAFSKDFSESPFLALSAHLIAEIESRGNEGLPSAKKIKSASKRVSRKLISTSARIATKALTLGLIGNDEIDALSDISDEIADATGELSEQAASYAFDEYLEAESDFSNFRSSLDDLALALSNSDSSENSQTVFIIDELDRCRPDFALGILETIKHLFDNQSVHFLLVTNIDYLVASVNARYGLGESSGEYLEKFYDFVVFFEEGTDEEHRHAAATLVSHRFDSLFEGENSQEIYDLKEQLSEFARAFDFSLRQASALATNAGLAFLSYRENQFRPSVIIAILALYRTKFPDLYQSIKKREFTAEGLLEPFKNVVVKNESYTDRIRSIIEFYSMADSEIDRDDARYSGYEQMTWRYNFGGYRDVFPVVANNVVDNFGSL